MPTFKSLLLFFGVLAILTAESAAADFGDDFANNLLTDLAPLLALFGERVTMQFMSESMGWADNFLLAMAPLGIVTVIVSAIRVGGPTWLKAIIGRARENLAVAEAELMSSTSKEVGELWNGHEIVRCPGRAPVREFICLVPDNTSDSNLEVDMMKFEEAAAKGYLKTEQSGLDQETAQGSVATLPEEPNRLDDKMIVAVNQCPEAPNISINSRNQSRRELRMAAIIGTWIQVTVLVYGGFATYYPTMRYPKEGSTPVAAYAFPCTAIGTVTLVFGMLLCANVVESKTKETTYKIKSGYRTRLVWLQQKATVGDQVFDAFAIFPEQPRKGITISRRVDKEPAMGASDKVILVLAMPLLTAAEFIKCAFGRLSQPEKSQKGEDMQSHNAVLAIKATTGAFISLTGYIVQFIGLRGIHWSVSIVQVGAVMSMAAIRAWVRRGLAKPPLAQRLRHSFELDWLAMKLGDTDNAACDWFSPDTEEGMSSKGWVIVTGGEPNVTQPGEVGESTSDVCDEASDASDASKQPQQMPGFAQNVMSIRSKLGELSGWSSLVSREARAVARAMEVVMDNLFNNFPEDSFTWSMEVQYANHDAGPVHFTLNKENGNWKSQAREIEASLSLWLYSIHKRQKSVTGGPEPEWLNAPAPLDKPHLRLLGPNTVQLRRDLQWWMPRERGRLIQVDADNDGNLEMENYKCVGRGSGSPTSTMEIPKTWWKREELPDRLFDMDTEWDPIKRGVLATESYNSLSSLYALDIFSAFMRAAAKQMTSRIEGNAELQPDDNSGDGSWKSFTLYNTRLSKMAKEIQTVGLGSLEEVYASVISPLSAEDKLPDVSSVAELVRRHAEKPEQRGDFIVAGADYSRLFQVARTFPNSNQLVEKATAILTEHLRCVTAAIEQRYLHNRHIEYFETHRRAVIGELNKGCDGQVLGGLKILYATKHQAWNWQLDEVANENHALKPLHFTGVREDLLGERFWKSSDNDARARRTDLHGWTLLHYVAADKSIGSFPIDRIAGFGPDMNARDLAGWTPLHYACQSGDMNKVRALCRNGADIHVSSSDGSRPLHCAAKNGNSEVVEFLVEAGASVDVLDSSLSTPLMWSMFYGHQKATEYLWPDANKRLRNRDGRNLLHMAALSGKSGLVGLCKDILSMRSIDTFGDTPLHLACEHGREAVVEMLVEEFDADLEAQNIFGATSLHLACTNGREGVIKLLVQEFGVDVDTRSNLQRTPLHLMSEEGHEAVAKLLVQELGAELEARDEGQMTPLHLASGGGHEAVVKLLVQELGADVEARDGMQMTPLHLASQSGHEAVVKLLIQGGAEIEARDGMYMTPLFLASMRGHEAVAKLLVEQGAKMDV